MLKDIDSRMCIRGREVVLSMKIELSGFDNTFE